SEPGVDQLRVPVDAAAGAEADDIEVGAEFLGAGLVDLDEAGLDRHLLDRLVKLGDEFHGLIEEGPIGVADNDGVQLAERVDGDAFLALRLKLLLEKLEILQVAWKLLLELGDVADAQSRAALTGQARAGQHVL